jgi:hypothetical protein
MLDIVGIDKRLLDCLCSVYTMAHPDRDANIIFISITRNSAVSEDHHFYLRSLLEHQVRANF